MWRGLYTAASGMITETKRTDTIAHNLANANTTGYKRDVVVSAEFEKMLIKRVNDNADNAFDPTAVKGFRTGGNINQTIGQLGVGSYVNEIQTDHSQGAFQTTGNQLDVAILGDGYFVVQTPDGVRYTRNGSFYKSSTGELQTVKGYPVLSQGGGNLIIPENATSVTINSQGQISAHVDGTAEIVGQLGFVSFGDDPRAMLKEGDSLYRPQTGAVPQEPAGTIEQGVLEMSNSNVVSEMVELINNYRIYEAGSKAVTTQDSLLDRAVNDVGRPG